MGNLGAMKAPLRGVGRLPLLCGVPKANKHGWQRRRRLPPRLFRESLFRPHSCHVNSSFPSPTQRNVVMLMPTGGITLSYLVCLLHPFSSLAPLHLVTMSFYEPPCTPFLPFVDIANFLCLPSPKKIASCSILHNEEGKGNFDLYHPFIPNILLSPAAFCANFPTPPSSIRYDPSANI